MKYKIDSDGRDATEKGKFKRFETTMIYIYEDNLYPSVLPIGGPDRAYIMGTREASPASDDCRDVNDLLRPIC